MNPSVWKSVIGCIALFAAGFAGSVVTRSQAPTPRATDQRSPLARWLDLNEETARVVDEHDPAFYTKLTELKAALDESRSALAKLFEAGTASDEAIQEQAEKVIADHAAVERHVLRYLLAVRDHLSAAQQKKLFGLCAEQVRQGRRRRWRGGRGQVQESPGNSEHGGGRGHGEGRRHGNGRTQDGS